MGKRKAKAELDQGVCLLKVVREDLNDGNDKW
jgi:hypothetical protein